MSEIEEFGVEEFGVEPAEEPAAEVENPAELRELIEDLTKQAAETMDAMERAVLRAARKAAETRLAEITKASGVTEAQWLDLSQAWITVAGDSDAFKKRLAELGGVNNDNYYKLTQELSAFHLEKRPTGRAKRGTKAKKQTHEEISAAADAIPMPTPESRWEHIVQHGKTLGQDANIVFDELGFSELTHDTVGKVLAEINRRSQPEEVEEFGAGEPDTTTASPAPESSASANNAEAATNTGAAESTESAAVPATTGKAKWVWDDLLKKAIDPETGVVYPVSWFLEKLGMAELPAEPDKEVADKILDVMHTYYLDPAARYRLNAEKMAAPLEARAKQWEALFGPYLDDCGEKFLPRYGARAKEENRGKLSAKTLQLISGAISWEKEGGTACTNRPAFEVWLAEKRVEMLTLKEQGTPEALEELAQLEDSYGLRLKTEVAFDKEKVKENLPPGWDVIPTNEFATRRIK